MGERDTGSVEVMGSSPTVSISGIPESLYLRAFRDSFFLRFQTASEVVIQQSALVFVSARMLLCGCEYNTVV